MSNGWNLETLKARREVVRINVTLPSDHIFNDISQKPYSECHRSKDKGIGNIDMKISLLEDF